MATVQQMHQALMQAGMPASQLAGLSEEQLMKLCNEKLRASLVGNNQDNLGEGFYKQYKYDQKLTLQGGKEVNVSKVATSVLKSGRKVETYIDVAGNQYFKYFSADGKELKESYFNKQEKVGLGSKFHFMDGKLYKSDMLGNLTVAEKETPKMKPVKQQLQEQKLRDDLAKKPTPKEDAVTLSKQLQEKFASEKDGSLIRKLSSAIDMGNYAAIPTIITNDFEYGLDTMDAGVKDIVHKVLFNMGPNQIDAMIKWAVDDNNDENLSLSEKIYNRIADVGKAADNMFVGSQGLVIAAFPPAVGMLPEVTAGIVTAGVTSPVIADGIVNTVEGVSDLMDATSEEETSAATQKLATGVLEDAAGIGIADAVIGRGVKVVKSEKSSNIKKPVVTKEYTLDGIKYKEEHLSDGTIKIFDESGLVKQKIPTKKGFIEKIYGSNNELLFEGEYQNGQEISYKQYNPEGKLIEYQEFGTEPVRQNFSFDELIDFLNKRMNASGAYNQYRYYDMAEEAISLNKDIFKQFISLKDSNGNQLFNSKQLIEFANKYYDKLVYDNCTKSQIYKYFSNFCVGKNIEFNINSL